MTASDSATETQLPADLREVAYHHEPYWSPEQGNWIKSLLLFFEAWRSSFPTTCATARC